MDLPFKVTLNDKNIEFEDNIDKIKIIPKFKEYENLNLRFNSNEDSYLEMPSLSDYSISQVNNSSNNESEKEEQVKFIPSKIPIKIYNSYDENSSPILPGIYKVIVNNKDKIFYGKFEIIPKDLSQKNWETMINEIENTALGLAQSSTKSGEYKPTDENKKYILRNSTREKLIRYSKEIVKVLQQILKNPSNDIEKNYKWIPKGQENFVDKKTIKNFNTNYSKIYAPKRIANYNNNCNKYTKYIMQRLLKLGISTKKDLKQIKIQIKEDKNETTRLKELNSKLSKINDLNYFVYKALNSHLFKNIKENNTSIPKSIILNNKYNKLYKIYKEIINKKTNMDRNFFLKYYWKETAKLYEIWVFINTLKALKDLNYIPNGWIFSNKCDYKLSQGTLVKFVSKKKDIYLNVIYDEEMNSSTKNDLKIPLKTESGNKRRPDIRIDIYKTNDDYLGSIILDAKYMPCWKISKNNRVDRQLHDYKHSLNSTFSKLDRRIEPVGFVNAIAASGPEIDEKNITNKTKFNGNDFHFFILNPSHGFEFFKNELDRQINDQIKYITEERNLYNY